MSKSLSAVNDQYQPSDSADKSVQWYDWSPAKDSWEWVEYDFEKPLTISSTKVCWVDDGPEGSCRIPDEWEILYLNGNIWEPVSRNCPFLARLLSIIILIYDSSSGTYWISSIMTGGGLFSKNSSGFSFAIKRADGSSIDT